MRGRWARSTGHATRLSHKGQSHDRVSLAQPLLSAWPQVRVLPGALVQRSAPLLVRRGVFAVQGPFGGCAGRGRAGKDREDSAQPADFQCLGDGGTRRDEAEVAAGGPGAAGGGDEHSEAQGVTGGDAGQVEDQPASGAGGYVQKALTQSRNPGEVQYSADREHVVSRLAEGRGATARCGHARACPSGSSVGGENGSALYGHHAPPRSRSHLDAAEGRGLMAHPSPAPAPRTGLDRAALEACRAVGRLRRSRREDLFGPRDVAGPYGPGHGGPRRVGCCVGREIRQGEVIVLAPGR